MIKTKHRKPKQQEIEPWLKPEIARLHVVPPADHAEGVTAGKKWDWHDCLVAQLAVHEQRQKRLINRDFDTAVRVVWAMGLLEFNIRFLGVIWSYWWWGVDPDADS